LKIRHRVAIIRRQVKRLVAIAAERAVQAESPHATPSFRSLSEAEAESFLGNELLARLASALR
jgi:hypothetical protein